MHKVDGLAVLAENRDVSLRQQVAQIDDHFHVSGQKSQAGNGLTHEDIQEGIALSRGRIEHIDRGKGRTVHPAIRGDPSGVSTRDGAAELAGDGMTALRADELLCGGQRNVGPGKIKNAAESSSPTWRSDLSKICAAARAACPKYRGSCQRS